MRAALVSSEPGHYAPIALERRESRVNRADFTFRHSLRVRWAEVDRQDVVFNGNYFLYFDLTVTEYWRAIGFRYPEDIVDKFGTDIYAVKALAEYHASATYDDVLEIGCRIARIGRSSLQFLFGIYRGEEHLTSGELVYVNADPKMRKSAPLPELLKQAILRYERCAPELASSQ
jgi:acyl-CoA thioester hydrolase